MTQANKFEAMGKQELREACRAAGIKYGKLDNAGMRAALQAAQQPAEVVEEEEEQVCAPIAANPFGALLGTVAPVQAAPAARRYIEGALVVEGEAKPKRKYEARTRTPKTPRPFVPRVIRKGYKIQTDRAEQNGVKWPSVGTVCALIWAQFEANPAIRAGELAALADANGWNRTTVGCQYTTWRRFMGISSRKTK